MFSSTTIHNVETATLGRIRELGGEQTGKFFSRDLLIKTTDGGEFRLVMHGDTHQSLIVPILPPEFDTKPTLDEVQSG